MSEGGRLMGRTLTRTVLELGMQDKLSFEEVLHATGMCFQRPAAWRLRYRQLPRFGHVLRVDLGRWPLQVLCSLPLVILDAG